MAEKLIQHIHCPICSKAMPMDKDSCSEECKEKLEYFRRANKKKNRIVYFMMILSFTLLIGMVIINL